MSLPLESPWRHASRWPTLLATAYRRFHHRSGLRGHAHSCAAALAVLVGIVIGTVRVNSTGTAWVTILDRRRKPIYLVRAVLLVGVMLAVPWLGVAFVVVTIAIAAVLLRPRPRSSDRAGRCRTPGAVLIGDLATVPGSSPRDVLDVARRIGRWADTTGRTLRADAIERRGGQYVRLFGMRQVGTRWSPASGPLVILVRAPVPADPASADEA